MNVDLQNYLDHKYRIHSSNILFSIEFTLYEFIINNKSSRSSSSRSRSTSRQQKQQYKNRRVFHHTHRTEQYVAWLVYGMFLVFRIKYEYSNCSHENSTNQVHPNPMLCIVCMHKRWFYIVSIQFVCSMMCMNRIARITYKTSCDTLFLMLTA